MHILVVGFGDQGSIHVGNLRVINKVEVSIATSAVEFQKLIKGRHFEGIVLSVPFEKNFELAKLCLTNTPYLFIEKPVAATLKEAKTIAELCEPKRIMVGQILRFASSFQFLKNALKHRTLGRPLRATVRRDSVKFPKDWHRSSKRFLCVFEGIHSIDTLIWLNEATPKWHKGRVRHIDERYLGDSEFELQMAFENMPEVSIRHRITDRDPLNEVQIECTEGTILIRDFGSVYFNNECVFHKSAKEVLAEALALEMKNFVEAIVNDTPVQCNILDVLAGMEVVEHAYENEVNQL